MIYDVIIIGGGVAGMQAAITAAENNLNAIILERDKSIGGKVAHKYSLFPTFTPVDELLDSLKKSIIKYENRIEIRLNSEVVEIDKKTSTAILSTLEIVNGRSLIIATGYSFFDATLKQEYGYGVYDNVITSYELEDRMKRDVWVNSEGKLIESVAFIHCVGSRDVKVNNEHCSRLCCVTGVKQAIEVCQKIKGARVFNYYMDMRMFGIGYEEMYREAQETYQVRFIRGRVSELSQNIDKSVRLKAEDTLIARPIAISVDLVVLLVGMCGAKSNKTIAGSCGLTLRENGFLKPVNAFNGTTLSGADNIFFAGCVESPKSVAESLAHGAAAAVNVIRYLTK